jgi:hypothetical protein
VKVKQKLLRNNKYIVKSSKILAGNNKIETGLNVRPTKNPLPREGRGAIIDSQKLPANGKWHGKRAFIY